MNDRPWVSSGCAIAPACAIDPILVAAADLFDQCGYEDTRTKDVAARACVSPNTQYRRYPTKRALLTGIVRAFADNLAVHLAALTERRGDADVERVCGKVGAGGGGKWAVDPGLLLAAFVGFCERYPSLTRVALAARDRVWSRCDGKATAALRGSIRRCIGARDASGVWVEQILNLLLFIARDLPSPEERWRLTGCAGSAEQWRTCYADSPIAACLELLLIYAYEDSDARS